MYRSAFLLILAAVFLAPSDASAAKLTTPNTLYSGLVGHWTFDGRDIVSGTFRDRSQTFATGTVNNIASSTFYSAGVIGQAGTFDGSNDFVSMTDNSVYDPSASSFSVSLWAKPNVVGVGAQGPVLVSHYNSVSTYPGWGLGLYVATFGSGSTCSFASSMICFWDSTRWMNVGTYQFAANTWYHITITKVGTTVTSYVNGIQVGTGTVNATLSDSTNTLRLAVDGAGTSQFNGSLDDVRIYNRALTAQEITRLYSMGSGSKAGSSGSEGSLSTNLISHWTFDGKDMWGGILRNKTGSGHDGSLQNIASTTFYSSGVIGQAGTFDGSNDFASTTAHTELNGASQLSVSGWAKLSSETSRGSIFSRWTSATNWLNAFQFWTLNDVNVTVGNGGTTYGTFDTNTGSVPPRSQWNHYVMVYDGTQTGNANRLKVYVNGTQVTLSFTGTIPATAPTMTNNDRIGYDTHNTLTLDGSLDDVRVYSKALTDAEVKRLYSMGTPSKASASVVDKGPLAASLVAHWTFDGKDMWGGVVRDRGTGNRSGALSGIASSTFYMAGPVGQAGNFDGTNDFVDFSTGFATFQETTPFSGAAWIKATASGERIIVAKWAANSSAGWQFFTDNLQNGKIGFFMVNANGSALRRAVGSTNVLDGQWHHVAFTYDGSSSASGIRFYVDGVADTATVVNNTSPGTLSDTTVRVGQRSGTLASYFQGGLDDIRIYNKQLSADEVKSLYNLGRQ